MTLRNNEQTMKMLRRSLLLRVLLNTLILVPSTTKRCLHGLEGLFVADVPAETLGFADAPARPFVDAGPRLRRTCEGAQVLHHWARGSDSRGHGDSQARRQERDTMTHRSEPVAQLVARVTVSLISAEAISTTLKGCLETLWPTEPSLDLVFLSKLCVGSDGPLSSTVEEKVMPRNASTDAEIMGWRWPRKRCAVPALTCVAFTKMSTPWAHRHWHTFKLRMKIVFLWHDSQKGSRPLKSSDKKLGLVGFCDADLSDDPRDSRFREVLFVARRETGTNCRGPDTIHKPKAFGRQCPMVRGIIA
ncbi:hypothetical protein PCH_Pc24g00310 [Penicillium rubens Wisconsin 54-1255]|uniref:Uncharacterized protein n=1 Tax=Penicillium rubens (strain ATCC 28089 / DSM 1075 / NRRL 1951 / Wisconsin 54-1255) TaxID=500485 RepID=B6HWJ3_PENRW|nr:hypothetical protein PCH_Pc24g00310 [Penicillium rubens Wisconsin 54-1255]